MAWLNLVDAKYPALRSPPKVWRNPKMIERLDRGMCKSNIWEHLTDITEECMADEDPEFEDIKAKTLFLKPKYLVRVTTRPRWGYFKVERPQCCLCGHKCGASLPMPRLGVIRTR